MTATKTKTLTIAKLAKSIDGHLKRLQVGHAQKSGHSVKVLYGGTGHILHRNEAERYLAHLDAGGRLRHYEALAGS